METSTNNDKKRLGAYYTPDEATDILAKWAIRSASDYVLEPSFGGCGFLKAVLHALKTKRCKDPIYHVYGCDIDEAAFTEAYESLVRRNGAGGQFFKRDFLKVNPLDFGRRFDVVIGNPPYVSYHNMESWQRASVSAAAEVSTFLLDRKASLWAYFVLHGLEFLADGGRMAWVLPNSFFHTNYARSIIDVVADNFQRALALQLGQRLFVEEGTEEHSVILLAEGWRSSERSRGLEVTHVSTLNELTHAIDGWQTDSWHGKPFEARIGFVLMESDVCGVLSRIEQQCNVLRIGDLADVKIGIVTGANRFFVINRELANKHGLGDTDVKYIFAKFVTARGLSLTQQDLERAKADNLRCLLIDSAGDKGPSAALRRYLEAYPKDIASNITFGKRDCWHQPDDMCIPDAFFPYMQHVGPRLVLNAHRANSTNTIHRVYFKESVSEAQRKATAISLLSTYSQLSAEVEGRTYGSGVLKHEPSEVRSIRLILPLESDATETDRIFQHIDRLLREGKVDEAQEAADQFVFGDLTQPDRRSIVETLRQGLVRARARREVKRR